MSLLGEIFGLEKKKSSSQKNAGKDAQAKQPIAKAPAKPVIAQPGDAQKNVKSPKSLEDELEQSWEYVQKKLYAYELPYPVINDDARTNTACIDMTDHQISIRKEFIDYLKSRGLDYSTILKGLLMHEAGHFKIIPWDLKNLIMMLYKAEEVCGSGSKKDTITNYFMDVTLNLDLMLSKRDDSVHQIYKAMEKTSKVDILLSHLYDFKAGMDFSSPRLPSGLENHLKELKKIKFTSRRRTYANLKRFAEIINDLIEDEQNKSQQDTTNPFEKLKDRQRNSSQSKPSGPLDDFSLKAYDKNEVERALKEIAKEMKKPSNYKKLYKFVKEEEKQVEKEAAAKEKANGSDKTNGSDANDDKQKQCRGLTGWQRNENNQGYDANEALIKFYTAKAEAYEIGLEDKSVLGGGDQTKSEFKPWAVEDPYFSIDIFNSYGRFIPEISKSWKESSFEGEKETIAPPDLLVMIDSSGSMPNPAEDLSPAALGALCAARKYLKKESRVAVVNFGDHTKTTGFTRDYDTIAKKILHYQCGGTELLNDKVYEMISKNNKEVDIMLISDGFIYNYDEVMRKLTSRKNTNRITIMEITRYNILGGFSGGSSRFQNDKIHVFPIANEEDIPKVVVNDLQNRGMV
ncbi:VWA domain-containing protein [Candidatus Woesearchaeota archaeon]|nr:VWA domain-containing protein [Candidatus Woesearchaeota archaeon]